MKKYYGIVQLDDDLNLIQRFRSVREAAQKVGCYYTNIYEALRTGNHSHGYYWWSDEDYEDYLADQAEANKPLVPDIEFVRITLLTTKGKEDAYLPVYRNPVEYR